MIIPTIRSDPTESNQTERRVTLTSPVNSLTWGFSEPEVGVEPTTFRLRDKRSGSDWAGPSGNCLLTSGANSIWSDHAGGSLIVGMIKGMINAHSISDRMHPQRTPVAGTRMCPYERVGTDVAGAR